MIGQLTNHLWQSTLFALAAAALTLAFRENRARVRYSLWLFASLKFLIPFSVLIGLGSQLHWTHTAQQIAARAPAPDVLFTIEQFSEPFISYAPAVQPAPHPRTDWRILAIAGAWLCGLAAIAYLRFRAWRRIRATVRRSAPLDITLSVETRLAPGILEPGIVGLWRPILLLPEGIVERLSPSEFQAILAHELCHVRRRDNLFASIHMLVEAVFWFHPLVWWIGARMLEERERACDEYVVSLGNQPDVYADAILSVCKLYAESPLVCVSGVSGADIRRRIEAIMSDNPVARLNLAKKALLACAAIAAVAGPVSIGVLGHPRPVLAQSQAARSVLSQPVQMAQQQTAPVSKPAPQPPAVAAAKFDVVSVKPCDPSDAEISAGRGKRGKGGGGRISTSPGRFSAPCVSLRELIREAYLRHPDGKALPVLLAGRQDSPLSVRMMNAAIEGGPAWVQSDRYTVQAEAEGTPNENFMRGPMLQALLEDRFKLKVRPENREIPVYELTVAGGAPKLKPAQQGSCLPWDQITGPPPELGQATVANMPCGLFIPSPNGQGLDVNGTTIVNLCRNFSAVLDRDVEDKTGIEGLFDIHLDIYREKPPESAAPSGPPPPPDPASTFADVKAALRKLGFKIEPAKGTGKFLVIDHVERPSGN